MGTVGTEWETQRFFSVNTGTGGCGDDHEAKSEPHGTATLLRCTLSAVVEALSEKCLLHKYSLCSILAESIVQDMPPFPANTAAL
jgi:hypothetical protein